MTKSTRKRGFTLPEVLIGIAVLSIAILTVTNLFVSITRGNKANMDDLRAYYLASEGLEAVRNIRDTHWFNNISWTGDKDFNFWSKTGVPVDFSKSIVVIVSRKLAADGATLSVKGDEHLNNDRKVDLLRENAPWSVSVIKPDEEKTAATRLLEVNDQFIHPDHNGGFTRQSFADASPFSRYIEIEPVDKTQTPIKAVKVKSVVFWRENNDERQLVLESVLTDWKAGPK